MKSTLTFLFILVACVFGAYMFPELGAKGGLLKSEWTTKFAVIAIFFLQGLGLASDEMLRGAKAMKAHVFIHAFHLFIIPAIVVTCVQLSNGALGNVSLELGFIYLAVLPTTISTASVFTTQAGGNSFVALLNSISLNILAVFIVPFWMAYFLSKEVGLGFSLSQVILKLCMLILLPLFVGQFVRFALKGSALLSKGLRGKISTGLIFYIVYVAFCNSFLSGIWEGQSLWNLMAIVAVSLVLLIVVSLGVWGGIRVLRFDYSTGVACFFTASQKSLAIGVPMAIAIFGGIPEWNSLVNVLLLPILIYHPLQLVLGGVVAERLKAKHS